MASVAGVVLVMIILIDCVQLNLESEQKLTESEEMDLLFHREGEEASFEYISGARLHSSFTAALYRSTEDGYLFLKNSSNPSQQSDSEQAERVLHCDSRSSMTFVRFRRFILKNLSLSDSGYYMTQCWRKGILKEERNYNLTVCKDQCDKTIEYFDDRVDVLLEKKKVSHGNILQVYKKEYREDAPDIVPTTLILQSKLPLVAIPDDLRGVLEVSGNLTKISFFIPRYNGDRYGLLIWSGSQCCLSFNAFELGRKPLTKKVPKVPHVLKPGGRVKLPCSGLTDYAEEVVWKTPVKDLSMDVSLNVPHSKEEDMYIETSNYSLVIPHVETKHVGTYKCKPDYITELSYWRDTEYVVFVCSDLEPTAVWFSLGNAAIVDCSVELNVTAAEFEFHHYVGQNVENLSEQNISILTNDRIGFYSWLPEETPKLYSTMVSDDGLFFLVKFNLTLNDSGLYLCRIWGYSKERTPFCYDRKIYLLHKHPFGIDSTFYRVYSSLMACGLLGMICAVISVHLRVRGRNQTSQERLSHLDVPPERRQVDPDEDDVNTADEIGE